MELSSKRKYFEKNKKNSQVEYCKFLLDNPCVDCGEENIIVLEPDHLRDKKWNISRMIKAGYPWKSILKELEKCEIVCRNCHHKRTHKRSGSFKLNFVDLAKQVDALA